jgi:predicted phage replisome organizer
MAKTKVYFWLRFDKKFFDNIFIKRLKSVSGGYAMTVIYIRLMLESLESDCILYYEGYFNELTEELALKLDVSEDDIQMTMAYFTKCGLIQIDTDGNARFPQAEALLEQETNWAQYKRKNRKVGQIPTNLDNVQPVSNSCPTEIEKEKEKEIELEEEIDKKTSATEISSYYQKRIGIIDGQQYQILIDYLTLDGMELEAIKTAIDKAADNSKRSFSYINSILKNWRNNGIRTMVQVEDEQRQFQQKKQGQSDNDIQDPFTY